MEAPMRFILALSFLAAITGLAAAAGTYYPQQVEYQQLTGRRRPQCHRTAIDPLVAACRVDVARDGDLHRRMRHRQSLLSWPMIQVLISVIVRRLTTC